MFVDHTQYGYMFGAHMFWWLLWVGLIIAIVVAAFSRNKGSRAKPRETAHDILKRRLASGELSVEEYEQRKALLDRDSASTGRA